MILRKGEPWRCPAYSLQKLRTCGIFVTCNIFHEMLLNFVMHHRILQLCVTRRWSRISKYSQQMIHTTWVWMKNMQNKTFFLCVCVGVSGGGGGMEVGVLLLGILNMCLLNRHYSKWKPIVVPLGCFFFYFYFIFIFIFIFFLGGGF